MCVREREREKEGERERYTDRQTQGSTMLFVIPPREGIFLSLGLIVSWFLDVVPKSQADTPTDKQKTDRDRKRKSTNHPLDILLCNISAPKF